MMGSSRFSALEEALGWSFRDAHLLVQALTHRSYCAENPEAESNERFEFLGDAVLGVVVTDNIFFSFPHLQEGELAKLRAAVVNTDTLAEVATEINLGEYLSLGKGEDSTGGRSKNSILADAMEAVLAAVYLDGGRDAAEDVVMGLLGSRITQEATGPGGQDFKTRLQELAARRFEQLPRYRVRHEGPDHDRKFFATVTIEGVERGTGVGRSKKQAEQGAAQTAWQWLFAADDNRPMDRTGSATEITVSSGGSKDA